MMRDISINRGNHRHRHLRLRRGDMFYVMPALIYDVIALPLFLSTSSIACLRAVCRSLRRGL